MLTTTREAADLLHVSRPHVLKVARDGLLAVLFGCPRTVKVGVREDGPPRARSPPFAPKVRFNQSRKSSPVGLDCELIILTGAEDRTFGTA